MSCRLLYPSGKIVTTHTNLAWIRRHSHNAVEVRLDQNPNRTPTAGLLTIVFGDGSKYLADFASFTVLKGTVRYWRNLYGTKLFVNGERFGDVEFSNEELKNPPTKN